MLIFLGVLVRWSDGVVTGNELLGWNAKLSLMMTRLDVEWSTVAHL